MPFNSFHLLKIQTHSNENVSSHEPSGLSPHPVHHLWFLREIQQKEDDGEGKEQYSTLGLHNSFLNSVLYFFFKGGINVSQKTEYQVQILTVLRRAN